MKTFTIFAPISFALLVVASPLGDRAVFQRHSGTPYANARRYILQSRIDSPAACAALLPSNITIIPSPDLTNSTTPLANSTTADNTTSTDNSTTPTPPSPDNTTTTDNSTSTDNSTAPSLPSKRSRRFWRRIEQADLPAVAQSWQDLCLVSGGDIFTNEPCVNLAGINGINALLAEADPCAQQDNADAMIAFAKSAGVNNTDALIANAVAYRQHPRNAMNILGVVPSTVYCQKAPQNAELVGLVNEQLDGVDPGIFGSPNIPLMPFGAPGTCPFGQTPDVTTCTCINGTDTTNTNGTDTTSASTNGTDTTATATAATDSAVSTATSLATDTTASVTDAGAPSATSSAATDTTQDVTSSASVVSTSAVASAPAVTSTPVITSPPTATSAAVAATTTAKTSGPNFQPGDISGDVNDPNGRRAILNKRTGLRRRLL